jgi:hypothetical protein
MFKMNRFDIDSMFKYLGYITFIVFIIYLITSILRVQNNFLINSFGLNNIPSLGFLGLSNIKEGFSEQDISTMKKNCEKIDIAVENMKKNIPDDELPEEVKQTILDVKDTYFDFITKRKLNDVKNMLTAKNMNTQAVMEKLVNFSLAGATNDTDAKKSELLIWSDLGTKIKDYLEGNDN